MNPDLTQWRAAWILPSDREQPTEPPSMQTGHSGSGDAEEKLQTFSFVQIKPQCISALFTAKKTATTPQSSSKSPTCRIPTLATLTAHFYRHLHLVLLYRRDKFQPRLFVVKPRAECQWPATGARLVAEGLGKGWGSPG